MTHHTVAMDNITVRAELPRDSHEYVVVYAELMNKYLEDHREEIAQAYALLVMFGTCEWPCP